MGWIQEVAFTKNCENCGQNVVITDILDLDNNCSKCGESLGNKWSVYDGL